MPRDLDANENEWELVCQNAPDAPAAEWAR
jgi:hypothetical protein